MHMIGFSASTMETSTAVICACGPGIKPVFKRYFPHFLSSSRNNTPHSTYYRSTGPPNSELENGLPKLNSNLGPSRSDEAIFELEGFGHVTNGMDIASQGFDGARAQGLARGPENQGSSIVESDGEPAVAKLGTPNYETYDSRQGIRHTSRDGRAISVDSLV